MKSYKIKYGDKEFDASEYQCKIFDNVEHGVGNMVISAAAGAAKSTTIINCINIIPPTKKILFIAFNKEIVESIRKKIGDKKNAKISTFHSLGYSIIRENIGKAADDEGFINEFKYRQYVKSNINDLTIYGETDSLGKDKFTYLSNILNLVDYARYYMVFNEKDIQNISDKYGLVLLRDEIAVCRKVMKWGKSHIDQIDYTDMIWLPNILNYSTKKYRFDWVMVDECLPYNSWVVLENGDKQRIGSLYNRFVKGKELPLVKSYNHETNMFEYKRITNAWKHENRPIITIKLGYKRIFKCTPNEKILTTNGYKYASDLTTNDFIVSSTNSQPYHPILDDEQSVGAIPVTSIEGNGEVCDVYDIEVEDNHNFIVSSTGRKPTLYKYNGKAKYEGIIVHNCQDTSIAEQQLIEKTYKRGCRFIVVMDQFQQINVWAGASENAVENFKKYPNTKEFKLPITYRCPKRIVELAKLYSDNIVAAPNAIDGEIYHDVSQYAPTNNDMVLCRTTAPLVDLHMRYMRVNKKSYLKGFENLKNDYISLISSTSAKTIDRYCTTTDGLFACLYKQLLDEVETVKKRYKLDDDDAMMHPAVFSMYDNIEGLKVISEGLRTVDELIEKISIIFSGDNSDAVQLSTIHKAKGLEADNVFILKPSLMPLKYAKKDWEIQTERNLMYVAYTRAKKTLNFIYEEQNTFGYSSGSTFESNNMKAAINAIKIHLNYTAKKDIIDRLDKPKVLGEKKTPQENEDKIPSTHKKRRTAASKFSKILK